MKIFERFPLDTPEDKKLFAAALGVMAIGWGLGPVAAHYLGGAEDADRQRATEELTASLEAAGFPGAAFPEEISLVRTQQDIELVLDDCTIDASADTSEKPFTYSISMNDGLVTYEFGSYDELVGKLPAGNNDVCEYFATTTVVTE